MEIFERSLTTQASSRRNSSHPEESCDDGKSCSECIEMGCFWCGRLPHGECYSSADLCDDSDQAYNNCPSVPSDVMLRHISGLVAAVIVVAVILNILNRVENRRRSNKLKRSIFTLPSYVYPSKEKRTAALKEARSQLRDHHLLERGMTEGQLSDGDEESEDGTGKAPSCAICLCPYENDEVIKVLPCSHDFHTGCLDSWLQLKATCPLCKAPAFGTQRTANRGLSSVRARTPGEGGGSPAERRRRRQGETAVGGRSLLGHFGFGAVGADASGNSGQGGASVQDASRRDGNHSGVVDRMEGGGVRAEEVEGGVRTSAICAGADPDPDSDADVGADVGAGAGVGAGCIDALGMLGAPDARELPTRCACAKGAGLGLGGLGRLGSSHGGRRGEGE